MNMNSSGILKEYTDVFKALAHPGRLSIIELLLTERLCVGEIEKRMGMRQANVSQHLNILKKANLLYYKTEGKKRRYGLSNPAGILSLIKCAKECKGAKL